MNNLMIEASAFIACVILAILTVFQVLLTFGAPLGQYAWGGSHVVLPTKLRLGSVISIILYFFFALIILSSAEVLDIPIDKSILNVGIWVLTAYFSIGVFMNGISRSKRERAVMTPAALALALTCLFIALN